MGSNRLVIYVTLLSDSQMAEWFAVSDIAGQPSDLWNDGFSDASRLPSDVVDSLTDWLKEQTGGGSPSTDDTSASV